MLHNQYLFSLSIYLLVFNNQLLPSGFSVFLLEEYLSVLSVISIKEKSQILFKDVTLLSLHMNYILAALPISLCQTT